MERENPDNENVLIGEVWEDASNKISYSNRRAYLWEGTARRHEYPFKDAILKYLTGQIGPKIFTAYDVHQGELPERSALRQLQLPGYSRHNGFVPNSMTIPS